MPHQVFNTSWHQLAEDYFEILFKVIKSMIVTIINWLKRRIDSDCGIVENKLNWESNCLDYSPFSASNWPYDLEQVVWIFWTSFSWSIRWKALIQWSPRTFPVQTNMWNLLLNSKSVFLAAREVMYWKVLPTFLKFKSLLIELHGFV